MKIWIQLTLGLLLVCRAGALELPGIFADQMVLQCGLPVPVWGTAEPGAAVTVEFAGQEKSVVAGPDGKWRVDLDPLNASAEPRIFQVSSFQANVSFSGVIVGEVWFAGGQSNMYRPFRMLVGRPRDPAYEPVREVLRTERAEANDPLLRQYRAGEVLNPYTAETAGQGGWSKAVRGEVDDFSAAAYFFGRELRRELDVPVALISCNKGGTHIQAWMPPDAFESSEILKTYYAREMALLQEQVSRWDEDAETARYEKVLAQREKDKAAGKWVRRKAPRKPEGPAQNHRVPGTLYNGMVHPIVPYAMRGVIWYQGESNSEDEPKEYGRRFAALVEGWRAAWGQERLPFYWCQLANFKAVNAAPFGDEVDGWVWVQDAQREALKLPDTGMAVLNDIGEAGDVHPKNKVDAGRRLSLWALSQVYGKERVCSGPLYRDAQVEGNKVIITFDHAGSGLMAGHKPLLDPAVEVNEPLKRFQVCGPDGEWKWAEAKITGRDTVEVRHADIPTPAEVRYAWSPNPEGANLYNREGLPASVFKTGRL